MKKLMILAAVAMTAVVTQAYDLKWGAISIYIPVAADATKSELGIVAVKENGSFAAGALAVQLYWVSTTGNEYIGEYKTTGEGEIASQVIASGTDSALYKAMVADHGRTGFWSIIIRRPTRRTPALMCTRARLPPER